MRLNSDEEESDAPPPDVEIAVMPTLRTYPWTRALRRGTHPVLWTQALRRGTRLVS